MRRLQIVIEQGKSPEDFKCVYVGNDKQKATALMSEEGTKPRAYFNRPAPIQLNRTALTARGV